ncbi:unnamed protein product [Blepharisma stoltei]|uniref:Uncharacterized protein n=1 Tax=Blepharisma stoltei TaxID=1481888 RepID=A0AAU9IK14_9CILI|nr:unnamed protein product [Blepharisma stoltei]
MKQKIEGKWAHLTLFSFAVPEDNKNPKISTASPKPACKLASQAKHTSMITPGLKYQTLTTELSIMPYIRVKDLMKTEKEENEQEINTEKPISAIAKKSNDEFKIKADYMLNKAKTATRPQSARVEQGKLKKIAPNHPQPVVRKSYQAEELSEDGNEMTLKEVLFDGKIQKPAKNMEINPLAMLSEYSAKNKNSSSRPFSAVIKKGNNADLYNAKSAKTLWEVRTQDKYKPKAKSIVADLMSQAEQAREKNNKIVERNINRFKESESKLNGEFNRLMKKVQDTRLLNELSMQMLKDSMKETEADIDISKVSNDIKKSDDVFTKINDHFALNKNGKKIEQIPTFSLEEVYETQTWNTNQKWNVSSKEMTKELSKDKGTISMPYASSPPKNISSDDWEKFSEEDW